MITQTGSIRQNPDGTWSHKMHRVHVTNKFEFEGTSSIIWNPTNISAIGGFPYEEDTYFFAVSPLNLMYNPESE